MGFVSETHIPVTARPSGSAAPARPQRGPGSGPTSTQAFARSRPVTAYRYTRLARFAMWLSRVTAHPLSFVVVGVVGLIWLALGPLTDFDPRLAGAFSVVTTVITFFLLFVIQHTQERTQGSLQLKLNELLRSSSAANDVLLDIEDLADRDLERIRDGYVEIAKHARDAMLDGQRRGSSVVHELTTLALLVDPSGALGDPGRLAAVRVTGMLDTPAEPFFDQLTEVAQIALSARIALLTFLEEDRQFLKSCFGLPDAIAAARELPASASFCQYTLTRKAPVVIPDLRKEPAVAGNPYVTSGQVLAYCGVPLVMPCGEAVGSLCVMDDRPRAWSDDHVGLLLRLASVAVIEVAERAAGRTAAKA